MLLLVGLERVLRQRQIAGGVDDVDASHRDLRGRRGWRPASATATRASAIRSDAQRHARGASVSVSVCIDSSS